MMWQQKIFREAAIEWLIAIDQLHSLLDFVEVLSVCPYLLMDIQPIQTFEHHSFKKMIEIAVHATNGVVIPTRKATHDEIINMFKSQLTKLKA